MLSTHFLIGIDKSCDKVLYYYHINYISNIREVCL